MSSRYHHPYAVLARYLLALVVGSLSLTARATAEEATTSPTPRKVTLSFTNTPLSQILAEFSKQTGVPVERRTTADPPVGVQIKDTDFWPALDAIAREANASIYLYQRGGDLALIDTPGPQPVPPVSYSGAFRASVKKVSSSLDFRADKRAYGAVLDFAWEPGFRPFTVERSASTLEVQDERGGTLKVPDEGTNKLPVTLRNAIEVELALPPFPRSMQTIGLLKGTLTVVGTPRMAVFRFATLDKVAKGEKLTDDRATMTIRNVETKGDPWSVQVEVAYPPGGPHFESFESWLVHNELYLEGPGGKGRLNPTDQSIDRLTDNQAVVTYFFKEDRAAKVRRGIPADWHLVCTAPTRLLVIQVPFEFKNVKLP